MARHFWSQDVEPHLLGRAEFVLGMYSGVLSFPPEVLETFWRRSTPRLSFTTIAPGTGSPSRLGRETDLGGKLRRLPMPTMADAIREGLRTVGPGLSRRDIKE